MEHIKNLLSSMCQHLEGIAAGNAVVAKPISVGDRHVIPLCELSLAFGGGGGQGEGVYSEKSSAGTGGGTGAGAGGAAKASPVAMLVIDGNKVRLETLG